MGMKMMSAKGSRFDKISLGRPCVSMVAACEVRLLFNWLKQSPAHTHENRHGQFTRETKKETRVQKIGNHAKTLQALKPRRTSSTQLSSNFIHLGFSPTTLEGLALSQKSSAVSCLMHRTGFQLKRPRRAYRQRRIEVPSTEPLGGERRYRP